MKNETGTRISICHEIHTQKKTSVGHFQDNSEVVMHEYNIITWVQSTYPHL